MPSAGRRSLCRKPGASSPPEALSVLSINPTSGPKTVTAITITGTGFLGSDAGASTVAKLGVDQIDTQVVVNHTTITGFVPNIINGVYDVVVDTNLDSQSLVGGFTVT